jgi:hypothetical protein
VQEELAILLIDLGEKALYFLVKTQFLFLLCVENQLFSGLALAKVGQRGWLVPFIKQLVKGELKCRRQPLEGFK